MAFEIIFLAEYDAFASEENIRAGHEFLDLGGNRATFNYEEEYYAIACLDVKFCEIS